MPIESAICAEILKAIPSPASTPAWVDLIKIAPSVVTAITAIVGVCVAKAGLNRWHTETIGKRKADLAEQALVAFYETRDVFRWVRVTGGFGGEGNSRSPISGESDAERDRRNSYFVPIERLTADKALFARLQTLKYAFVTHFGSESRAPFDAMKEVHDTITTAVGVLMQISADDWPRSGTDRVPLLNDLGRGAARRPDDIDRKIEKAVEDIEAICRPVLDKQR